MNSFQYVSANTPDEAVSLIGQNGRYLAGGIDLLGEMKDYIVSPNVAVNIEEVRPMNLVILGEVARPGAFPLENDFSLAHAIAVGGGLTDYASRNSIFVVRREPRPMRIRFAYQDIYRNVGGAGDFQLRPGDIVEVE